MRLTDYLDKGASLGPEAPCLTTAGRTLSYFDVQKLSWRIARALDRSGIGPGDKVAILSANDPVAFGCVFGISRAGAVWCPVNPRNEAAVRGEPDHGADALLHAREEPERHHVLRELVAHLGRDQAGIDAVHPDRVAKFAGLHGRHPGQPVDR